MDNTDLFQSCAQVTTHKLSRKYQDLVSRLLHFIRVIDVRMQQRIVSELVTVKIISA